MGIVADLYRRLVDGLSVRPAATPVRKFDQTDARGWESAVVKSGRLVRAFPGDRGRATREIAFALAMFANGDGANARPSAETIARIVGLSERRVRDHLRRLVEAGFVIKHERPGFADSYQLAAPGQLAWLGGDPSIAEIVRGTPDSFGGQRDLPRTVSSVDSAEIVRRVDQRVDHYRVDHSVDQTAAVDLEPRTISPPEGGDLAGTPGSSVAGATTGATSDLAGPLSSTSGDLPGEPANSTSGATGVAGDLATNHSAAERRGAADLRVPFASSGGQPGALHLGDLDDIHQRLGEVAVTPQERSAVEWIIGCRSVAELRDREALYRHREVVRKGTLIADLYVDKGRLLKELERRRREAGRHVCSAQCRSDDQRDIDILRKLRRVTDPGRAATEHRRLSELRTAKADYLSLHRELARELNKTIEHLESLRSAYEARYVDDDYGH